MLLQINFSNHPGMFPDLIYDYDSVPGYVKFNTISINIRDNEVQREERRIPGWDLRF